MPRAQIAVFFYRIKSQIRTPSKIDPNIFPAQRFTDNSKRWPKPTNISGCWFREQGFVEFRTNRINTGTVSVGNVNFLRFSKPRFKLCNTDGYDDYICVGNIISLIINSKIMSPPQRENCFHIHSFDSNHFLLSNQMQNVFKWYKNNLFRLWFKSKLFQYCYEYNIRHCECCQCELVYDCTYTHLPKIPS